MAFVDEDVSDELLVVEFDVLELGATGFVVTFIVVSNGVITAGKTTPLRSIACKGTEPL